MDIDVRVVLGPDCGSDEFSIPTQKEKREKKKEERYSDEFC